ncbi:MAG: TonB-dependent receptor, partial [Candidatus Tectomicrobia bacterium]
RWAENTVQLNVSFFYMDWSDFQAEVVDPSFGECRDPTDPGPCSGGAALPWVKVVGNVGDAHSSGVEAQFAWVPADGWDIGANAQWLEAEIDEDIITDPRAGQSLTKGQRLPNVAEFQASAWASYTWPVQFMGAGDMFLRGQFSHTGDSINLLIPERSSANPSHMQDSYSIADVRLGLISQDGDWRLEVFVNNVGDERAELFQNTGDFEWAFSHSSQYDRFHRVYTNRPREYGVRFTKTWSD